jgi:CubicO group peptidase (beta-lactamase class C family)
LEHTAGIPSYKAKEVNNEIQYNSITEAVAIFQDRDLVSYPGEEYHYASYGYVLLGLIIEKVSGISYAEYMQLYIWDACGMNNTGIEEFSVVYPNKSLLYTTSASGYFMEAKQTNLSDRIPGGGVYSTLEDLLKFTKAILSNSLITNSTLQQMLIPIDAIEGKNNYGLGWSIYGEKQGYQYGFGHTGSQRGAANQLIIIPDQKASIVVLSNTSGSLSHVKKVSVDLYENLVLQKPE